MLLCHVCLFIVFTGYDKYGYDKKGYDKAGMFRYTAAEKPVSSK